MILNVTTKTITLAETGQINTEEINVEKAMFNFSEEWLNVDEIIALFTVGDETKQQAVINGECYIPPFEKPGKGVIGVYGYKLTNDEKSLQYDPTPVFTYITQGSFRPETTAEIPQTDFERYIQIVREMLADKQDTLVSGENIKTINNLSLLGSGNIDIQGGGGTSDYDDLTNKPSVNGTTLIGNKTSADLGLQDRTIVTGTDGKNYYVQFGMQSGKPVLILTEVQTNE